MAGRTLTKPFGERPQRLVLIVGLLLGAVAAVTVAVAINAAGSSGGDSKQPVVVAAQDIPANTRVTADMLQVTYLPADQVEADAFSARSHVTDRIVTQEIKAGQQVVPSVVSNKAGDSLAFKVTPGMRAVSVEVQEVVTAGGNIRAGDHVDIVGIFEVCETSDVNQVLAVFAPGYSYPQPPPRDIDNTTGCGAFSYVLTITLLQNVKVLSVAQSLVPESAADTAGGTDEEPEPEPKARTATLELTPDQAQLTTLADEYGILRMSGRAVNDTEIKPVAPIIVPVEKTN